MISKPTSLVLPFVAGVALLSAGCAASAGADPAAPSAPSSAAASSKPAIPAKPGSIVDAQWRLKTDPTAWFRVQGSNIAGHDSCNALAGSATALTNAADKVDFGAGVAATMRYCPDPKGTQTAIREALTGVRVWNRAGSELVLTDAANNRSWTFVLTAASPSSSSKAPTASTAPAPR